MIFTRFLVSSLTLLALMLHHAAIANCSQIKECVVEFWNGYRFDDLQRIVSNKKSPPTQDVGKWNDIQIWQIGFNQRLVDRNHIYFRGSQSYGWLFDGNADISFFNSGNEDFRANYESDKGCVYDLSGGLGFQLSFCRGRLTVSPLAGFSYQGQQLHMYRGYEVLRENASYATGILENGAEYRSHWYGPWVGTDLQYQINQKFNVSSELEYHWGRHRGEGNFYAYDAPDDFSSDRARAHGFSVSLGANYAFCECWSAGLKAKYQQWRTSKSGGIEYLDRETLLRRGLVNTSNTFPLNSVKWQTWSVSALISRQF